MGETARSLTQHEPLRRAPLQQQREPALVPHRDAERAATARDAGVAHLISARALQPQLLVGASDDPFEREADRTAALVTSTTVAEPMRASGGSTLAASLMRVVQRAAGAGQRHAPILDDEDKKKKHVQKHAIGTGPEVVPAGIEAGITRLSAGGDPLSPALRAQLEPRFGFDFSGVRTHVGGEAAGAARALGARAFTVGDHIFFGAGEFAPSTSTGQRLLAHELTHTIQQQPAATRAARLLPSARAATPIAAAAHDAPVRAQRADGAPGWLREKIRAYIQKDFAPWDLLTLLIGYDPISEQTVKGTTRDWIHAAMKLAPDGEALFGKLDGEGKIESIAKWWDGEVAKLDLTFPKILALVKLAWASVGLSDATDPAGAWTRKVKPIFQPTIDRLWTFIKAVGAKVLQVVKDLVIKQVGEWAQKQKGYTLLTFILGRDPVTDEVVKRTPKGFVWAVLDLVPDGDKMKENLEKSKTIEKTVAWLDIEIAKLDLTWDAIKKLFTTAWAEFKVVDLLSPKALFEKMAAIFGAPLGRLFRFLLAVGKKILEFIFEGAMMIAGPIGMQIVRIVKKAGDTFDKIIADPVGFVGNLVQAVKLGFTQFGQNILDHLKTGIIEWLVGSLEGAGIELPKVWDLKGILSLALQILGISYAKMRVKMVKVLGEKTVGMLETAFEFVRVLVTEGPAAAWQKIVDAIGSVWDLVIGGIRDWAVTKIVKAAIVKLVTLFNPAGAVIQAILAIYHTIAFFVEKIKQILALVESVIDSIANIAAGKLAQAANYVERTMAKTIPVIIGFLAEQVGLGDVSEGIRNVITALQEKVDKGIDAVIAWIVEKAKSLFGKKASPEDEKWAAAVAGVEKELSQLEGNDDFDEAKVKELLPDWQKKYGFTSLALETSGGGQEIVGEMSPKKPVKKVPADGSKSDPFPLTYPKPKSVYPTLYFGDRTQQTRTQKNLEEGYNDPKRRAAENIHKYVPFPSGGQELPHGQSIGIRGKHALKVGDLVGPLQEEGTTGGGKINDQLEKYGYNAKDAAGQTLQGDHYWEIQYGGENEIDNLWPLEKGINNASGNYLKNLEVTMPSGKKKKVPELKANKREYWFKITGFRQP